MQKEIYLSLHLRQQSASFGLLKKNICFCCFYRFFPMFMFFHIKISIFISNLVWIGSGIFRNMSKSYVCLSDAPAGAFFSEKKLHISGILDIPNSQKITFKLFLVCGCSRRGFFPGKLHISIFIDITISQKMCFWSKT